MDQRVRRNVYRKCRQKNDELWNQLKLQGDEKIEQYVSNFGEDRMSDSTVSYNDLSDSDYSDYSDDTYNEYSEDSDELSNTFRVLK